MLAITNVSNTTVNVYSVTNTAAYVYVDIWPIQPNESFQMTINNYVYFSGSSYDMYSAKLALSNGDVIGISTTGTVNVFVHGIVQ